MMRYMLAAVCCVLLCATASTINAQGDPAQAYVGAQIIPISGPPIQNGVIVVSRGKIVAVGTRESTKVPAGAQIIDVTGKVIMPGLVDTHSHIGGGSGGDGSGPIQPETRILDSINVRDNGIMRARAGGITTVNVMPGSGHLSSGQTLYLKLRAGRIVDDLLIKDAQGNIAGGLKMANGTNSLRAGASGPFPGTRAKSASLVREQFVKAQEYREKIRRAQGDATKLPVPSNTAPPRIVRPMPAPMKKPPKIAVRSLSGVTSGYLTKARQRDRPAIASILFSAKPLPI